MSPEQAQGKTKEIDHRSDIFSFGCVLFEAVTGRRPFEAESNLKSLHKLVYGPPPSINDFNPTASPDLQRIVRRCLAKDPEDRYQTIKDVAIELKELRRELESIAGVGTAAEFGVAPSSRRVSGAGVLLPEGGTPKLTRAASTAEYIMSGIKQHRRRAWLALGALVAVIGAVAYFGYSHYAGGSSAGTIRSIAVLPFVNASGDPNAEYLSDGVTESIINSLTQLPHVKVLARTTAFRYKGREAEPQKVGKELGVDALLTGRVLQQGDTLTIQTDLIRVSDSIELWGDRYNRKLADIFTVENQIAGEISNKLRLK